MTSPSQVLLNWWFGEGTTATEVAGAKNGLWFGYKPEQDEEARKHLRVCVIANGGMIHVVGQAIAVLPSAMARSASAFAFAMAFSHISVGIVKLKFCIVFTP